MSRALSEISALACRRRKSIQQLEVTQIGVHQSSTFSLQHMASSWPSELPEAVLAIVLEFAGPSTWYSGSCVSQVWHQRLWHSPTVWSSILLSFGEEPGR